jgi:hypothetical protein
MPGQPIKLGSAITSALVFDTGSRVTTSSSGIQTCAVQALCSNGADVYNQLPAAGATFGSVFGHFYLPATFLVDYTDGGPEIEYLEGRVARVTILFKRPDPLASGETASRKVFIDSVLNYKSILSPFFYSLTATGEQQDGIFGFPEPVCTVRYNTTSPPSIGAGNLSTLYALPGSQQASGFPPVPTINVPYSVLIGVGGVISYFNGTAFVSAGPMTVPTTFNFNFTFNANPKGWQLTRLKYDPVAGSSFYDVEQNWRNFYFFTGVTFINRVPP